MFTNVEKILPENPLQVITLEQAKKQLRVEEEFVEEDDLIQGYIDAALLVVENYINGDIQEKQLVIHLDKFQESLVFEAYPIQQIESVEYYQNEEKETLSLDSYYTSAQNLKQTKLVFKEQPNTDDREDAVIITVSIGYSDAGEVPAPLKQAMLLQISDMYERRENRLDVVATAAQALMRPYRKYT